MIIQQACQKKNNMVTIILKWDVCEIVVNLNCNEQGAIKLLNV